MNIKAAILLCLITVFSGNFVRAQEESKHSIEELVVYGRAETQMGETTAASSGQVGGADIQLASRLRVGELVESVPGVVATQHSGTGKANQYFLRGFNLDHGTDFSAHAGGVPLNMRSHGHGQGYLDLNFLIPEMISTVRFHKGPYHASIGDFSSAGSVEFFYYDHLTEPVLSATIGQDMYRRILGAGSKYLGTGVLTVAADVTRSDGPWQKSENLTQDKFQLRYVFPTGDATVHLNLQGYQGKWTSTDQIPERAVSMGLVDRLGIIDPDLGGETQRFAVSAGIDFTSWSVSGYALDYDFTLFSNFTYFLNNPKLGDEFEQQDSRKIYGINLDGKVDLSRERRINLRWGVQARWDSIGELGLYRTQARVRHDAVRRDRVAERSIGAFSEVEINMTDKFRGTLGIRGDYYDWDVSALRLENRGTGNQSLFSPKLNLAYRISDNIEAYANWGRGFHSNDVRGKTVAIDPETEQGINPVDVLVKTEGSELGLRFEKSTRFNATLVAFKLDVGSELIFVGDAGGTQASAGSQRVGLETSLFWQPVNWLALDVSYTYTNARFVHVSDAENRIPGSIKSTGSLGVMADLPGGIKSNIRVRYIGDAPLTEDGTIQTESSLVVNAGISYRFKSVDLRVDIFNLFDSTDNDISYYYASRFANEPSEGVNDVHFHPLEPRTLRATVTWHPKSTFNRLR
ncbi:MAG: TonB-dependent receptor [Pseudomonadota bacterium]